MNLLLVDDDPMALHQLELLVGNVMPFAQRYSFLRPQDALECARKYKIDIAFLDIKMNGLDGVTLAKGLQQFYPQINLIFCTSHPEYSMEAHDIFSSAYLLKPIKKEKLVSALQHLRFPVVENTSPVSIQCFGVFEVYHNGAPIPFRYRRTKELLAYLVSRGGAFCSTQELEQVLFGAERRSAYFQSLRRDLLVTFERLGCPEVVRLSKGLLAVNRDVVRCDYFDYKDGKLAANTEEFMSQYSFGIKK